MGQAERHEVRRTRTEEPPISEHGWVRLTPWQTVNLASLTAAITILAAIEAAVHTAASDGGEGTASAAFLTLFIGLGLGLSGLSTLAILLFRGYVVVRLPEALFPVKGRWVAPFLLVVLLAILFPLARASGLHGAAIAIGLWGFFLMPALLASDVYSRRF